MINPKKRSPAQKRATRALVARNKKRSPTRARTRTSTKTITVRRRKNPAKRNTMVKRGVESIKTGAVGSVGALAGSVVAGLLPLPENLKSGNMAIAARALIGIGTGFGVAKFVDKKVGEQMASGAVTVALHGAMKDMLANAMPNLTLGDDLLGDELLGYEDFDDDLGFYTDNELGMYTTDDELGYTGSGHTGQHDSYNDSDSLDF